MCIQFWPSLWTLLILNMKYHEISYLLLCSDWILLGAKLGGVPNVAWRQAPQMQDLRHSVDFPSECIFSTFTDVGLFCQWGPLCNCHAQEIAPWPWSNLFMEHATTILVLLVVYSTRMRMPSVREIRCGNPLLCLCRAKFFVLHFGIVCFCANWGRRKSTTNGEPET